MDNFAYHAPTAIYCGNDCLSRHRSLIRSFGTRAFIITSHFTGNCRNLALDDVTTLFAQEHISFTVCEEVEENPTVESVKAIAERIRANGPDFILSIGGGSSLDTAKAANVLLNHPASADPYEVFYHGEPCVNKRNCGVLPLLGIPTTAGSGSEVMGYAVLTRTDTHTKLRMNQLSYFDAAFLDARYIAQSPQWLLDSGAMDALAHGIEGYVNAFSQKPGRIWHDYGFELFAGYKDALLSCTLGQPHFEQMLAAATVQGMAVMQSGTTIPHGMGYPLTHFKNIPHGIASCMTIPAYLDTFRNKSDIAHILNACGFASLSELRQYVQTIVSRNVSLTVTPQEIETWTDTCFHLDTRIARHPEPISRNTIRDIYYDTLSRFIVPANRMCG